MCCSPEHAGSRLTRYNESLAKLSLVVGIVVRNALSVSSSFEGRLGGWALTNHMAL